MACYIGVDVGTSSVRAALVTETGFVKRTSVQQIKIWNPRPGYYEQSSEDIWQTVCTTVRKVIGSTSTDEIRGIGFDATCSLVVLDTDFKPLTVCPSSGQSERNVIMWMDHRAEKQASVINSTNHKVLKYVGGQISLEMEMPKLLWLKENMNESCWQKAGHFFDLPDFLTWRSTGSLSRSLCSLVCKWAYVASSAGQTGWSDDFLKLIGLEELTNNNHKKIGNEVLTPGKLCGKLSDSAAKELGLSAGIAVGTSLIDAHAGGLGVLGCQASVQDFTTCNIPVSSRLAIICGTSTCHMAVSPGPIFVPGVWGPYYSAMVPGMWLNEAGQSAAGKLIDHIVETHSAYAEVKAQATVKNQHVYEYLNKLLETVAKQKKCCIAELTETLHVWPDFHGNRSPLADSTLTGMVSGLTLASGEQELACLYLATVQALACGTKHIIDSLAKCGHAIEVLYGCGGLCKNKLYVQAHADVTGFPIVLPDNEECVLVGAAILGACASGDFGSIQDAMTKMGGKGKLVMSDTQVARFYEKKYKVFLKMVEHQKEYSSIMQAQ